MVLEINIMKKNHSNYLWFLYYLKKHSIISNKVYTESIKKIENKM